MYQNPKPKIKLMYDPLYYMIFKCISRLYIGNCNEINVNESKFFTKMNASIAKVDLPDRPTMNDTTAGKLAQTQFISSTIKVR